MANLSKWQQELELFSRLNAIVLLTDNIYDKYPLISNGVIRAFTNLEKYLANIMKDEGYRVLVGYDPIRGFYGLNGTISAKDSIREFEAILKEHEDSSESRKDDRNSGYRTTQMSDVTYLQPRNYEDAARIAYIAQTQCKALVGIVMRFSSRFVGRPDDLDEDERRTFMYLRLSCEQASSIQAPHGANLLQNRIYLLADKLNDLPAWFYLGVPQIKSISIPKPDYRIRTDIIEKLFAGFSGTDKLDDVARREVIDKFVGLTDDLSTTDIDNIRQLMIDRDIEFGNIEKAVQLYRHGVQDNPWEDLGADFLAGIEGRIKARIVGQDRVIKRAVDVIKRAALGMSGLQQSSNSSRPRGVFFLAGPTGTGKTELAKAIAEQLFKDERNIVRFDMSEYREPQSDQRLLGAPPGYIGYEEGGQLTNAVREKPFSVLLFDEIEKAHPSILDKFLQILDDGRITDGRGDTVYFQDCLIVFTSNLGIMKAAGDGTWVPNVSYDDRLSEEQMEDKVIAEIRRYFREYISRPELLNRIGDNILVFDYIREESLAAILKIQTDRIFKSMRKNNHVEVTISPEANDELFNYCLTGLPQGEGGRGIGNSVEKYLINPLSRYMFDHNVRQGEEIRIAHLAEMDGVITIQIV